MWLINKTANKSKLEVVSNNLTAFEYKVHRQNESNCGIFRTNSVIENDSRNELDSGSINYLAISIFLIMQLFSAVIFYLLCDTSCFKEVEEVNYNDKKLKKSLIVNLSESSFDYDDKSSQLKKLNSISKIIITENSDEYEAKKSQLKELNNNTKLICNENSDGNFWYFIFYHN